MPVPRYGPKWRVIGVVLFIGLIASYVWFSKETGFMHGGSQIGLIYGFITLFLMLLLLFFGIRKRWYRSNFGTVNEWLQSHIYLGVLSLFVMVAHTGFRFEDKVAVALFAIITITILSGVFGAILYATVPRMLTEVQSNLTNDEISDQLNQLAKTMARVSSNKSAPFQRIYQGLLKESMPKMLAGWRLLMGGGKKKTLTDKKGEWTQLLGMVPKEEQDELRQLLVVSRQHKELHLRLIFQQRYKNILEAWLYIHLPLSVGMLALIIAHLYGVFYYGKVTFN